MSVRKGDQAEGVLQVTEKMKDLIRYTHARVRDNSVFPKSERWLLAKSIWDAASGAHAHILRANGIRVENDREADERILHEKLAIGCLDELIALIDRMNGKKIGRERRRLKKLAEKERRGELVPGTTANSFNSWKANAERGDSFFRVKRMEAFFKEVTE